MKFRNTGKKYVHSVTQISPFENPLFHYSHSNGSINAMGSDVHEKCIPTSQGAKYASFKTRETHKYILLAKLGIS